MKRIISIALIAVMIAACLALAGCDDGKLTIKEFKIIEQSVTMQVGSVSGTHNHQLTTECKVNENIPAVTVKYIFTKDGNSYYIESESKDLLDGSTRSFIEYLNVPTYAAVTYDNVDSSKEPLTIEVDQGDILDVLGKGTVIKVEIYENGQLLAEESTTY